MKKTAKTVVVMMIAALTLGSISVYAAEAKEQSGKRERPAFSKRVDAPEGNVGIRLGAMGESENGKRAELTEGEKAAKLEAMKENRKKALDDKLAAGEITQEEYDAAIAKLESGEFGKFDGNRQGGNRRNGKGFCGENGERPELTEEEKAARLETMKENRKQALNKRLADGKITQEQYDEAVANLESGEFGKPGGNRQGKNRWNGKGFGKNAEQAAAQAEI